VTGIERPLNDEISLGDEHARKVAAVGFALLAQLLIAQPHEDGEPGIGGVVDHRPGEGVERVCSDGYMVSGYIVSEPSAAGRLKGLNATSQRWPSGSAK